MKSADQVWIPAKNVLVTWKIQLRSRSGRREKEMEKQLVDIIVAQTEVMTQMVKAMEGITGVVGQIIGVESETVKQLENVIDRIKMIEGVIDEDEDL